MFSLKNNWLFEKLGMDGATAYRILWRLIQGMAGLVTVWVIAHYLSLREQGFYFTFASVISLQLLVELGISVVIIQFASHEKAFLEWDTEKGVLLGNQKSKERLVSLVKLIAKWYSIASVIVIFLLLAAGFLFFKQQQVKYPEVSWQGPWIFLVLSFALFFCCSPFLNILEGAGRIKEVTKARVQQDFLANVLFWLSCILGFGLWCAPILYLVKSLAIFTWLGTKWRKNFFTDCFSILVKEKISWRKEIFPFQWKMALSCLSGFLIFQLFTPVLFAFQGAEIAGQMGLTLSAFNGIIGLSMAWIQTKTPLFGELIAKQDFTALDKVFWKVFWQSSIIIIIMSISLVSVIFILQRFDNNIGKRFLSMDSVLLLALITIVNHVIFAQASYLRAHKKEPLLTVSVVSSLFMALSTYFLGKYYGAFSVTLGYFIITCFLTSIWITLIFYKKRAIWHCNVNEQVLESS
jgi:hypothetical protein